MLPAIFSTTLCKWSFDVFSHSVTRPEMLSLKLVCIFKVKRDRMRFRHHSIWQHRRP